MNVACAVHPAPIRDRNGSLIDISPFRWFRSIGDDYQPKSKGTTAGGAPPLKDSFLPDQTTRALAEQTNATLQAAVRRDGPAFVSYLDGFIMALREELDSPSNGGGADVAPGAGPVARRGEGDTASSFGCAAGVDCLLGDLVLVFAATS